MKMMIDRDWLLKKIAAEPDDACYDAGILHPDAPLPRAIQALSGRSTDLEIMDVIEQVERGQEPYRTIFMKAVCQYAEIEEPIYASLKVGIPR